MPAPRTKLVSRVLGVGLGLALGGAAPSRAAEPAATPSSETGEREVSARSHFRKAEADYAAGHYAEALGSYQAGYDATPLPGFLVNIAQCQRRLGDLGRARATYGKFIMVAPDSPLAPEVRGLMSELDRLLADDAAQSASPAEAAANATSASARQPSLAAPDPEPPTNALAPRPTDGRQPAERSPRWWLWGGAAVVALAGATTAVLLLSGGTTTVHDGSLGTLRR